MRERTASLMPTPAEIAAMVFACYFLWFLADGKEGIIAGFIGVAAGMALSRAAAIAAPGRRGAGQAVWMLVILGFVVAAPFVASGDFRTSQLAVAGYSAIAVLGLNLLTGYTGQASIGHSAFLGIGAYVAAIMVNQWGISMGLAMVVGTLAAGLAGFLIGFPALRLSGPYLAIATLGLAVIFPPLLKLRELEKVTGGHNGINLFAHSFGPPVHWDWLTDARWYYFITMLSLGVGVLLLYNLLNSPVGRSFRAVRDNEIAAAATGVNVAATKLTAFAISSAYAGFAGGLLFIITNRIVSPETFTVLMAIEFLVVMVIGGTASIPGSLIGAFFLVYVYREGLETVARETESGSDTWLILAGIFIAGALLFGSDWARIQTRKAGAYLSAQYGEIALNVVKLAAVLALGFGFTWIFRKATEELLDLIALRGAITGAFLIIVILFLPGGLAAMVSRIQTLTWSALYSWIRIRLVPARRERAGEAAEAVATTQ